jgi:hypothetical protein
VKGIDYKVGTVYTIKCWKNGQIQLHENFSNSIHTLPKSQMHIFNVSIITVQGLKSVSLKVWEKLITQSRYCLCITDWENDYVQLHVKSKKCPNTSKNTNAHLQCIRNNCAKVWRMSAYWY